MGANSPQKLVEGTLRRAEAVIAAEREQLNIKVYVLECNVIKSLLE